ncbi:hypothetical protein RJ641_027413 [Dillenia turbinata]|uniref:Calcium-transporting ATPase n=1 Tax=Dillenia turbinata TaxID=194707 RepID=A0AAN8W5C2_9MAGN
MANEKDSPLRRDIEAGESVGNDVDNTDPFDIPNTKNAPIERLKRWRQAALVLNASRRFRYTLDLKKEEEKAQIRRKIRAHAQVLRAAILFKEAASKENGETKLHEAPTGDFGIAQDQLLSLTRDHDLKKGIPGNDEDIMKRKTTFGSNTYPKKKPRSFWVFLWEAWQDLTLIILMGAAVASLALGIKTEGIKEGWYDGASIAFAVILVIVVTAISDYRQSLQFQNLNEEKRNIHLEVIRGGRRVPVSIFDIVVGDVVPLKIGDQVPADGILITGHSLAIDESSMTGESKIVHKDAKAPFLMSGCKVADGFGTMLVTTVGINTEWGLLMASISEDTGEETPLQVRLNGIATFIGIVGLSVALVVLVVLLIRFFTGNTTNPDGSVQFKAGKTKVGTAIDGAIKIVTVAVTIVVVAVPEGLPLAVTLTLAYSMRKMMRDKALVRRLSACETMGSATTICSDKTGTLTINQMTVVEAYVSGKKMDPPDDRSLMSPMVSTLLIEGIAQNSTGSVFVPEAGGPEEVTGSPTEKAILNWGLKLGMNFEATRLGSSILHVFPFNSEKKRGGVAVKLPDSQVHIHWKGAAELVLASCGSYIDENNSVVAMDEEKMNFFKKAIEDMAAGSLRCVAIAFRNYEAEKVPTDEEQLSQWALPEDQLVLLAIIGLKDPCRPEVKRAMQLCRTAGVKVRMVTGDNLKTAKAIALECGILGSDDDAVEPNLIEGMTFRALSDVQRQEIAEKISVMGRSSPNDKLLLVQALKKKGNVVAVTGDGTNDAPALHESRDEVTSQAAKSLNIKASGHLSVPNGSSAHGRALIQSADGFPNSSLAGAPALMSGVSSSASDPVLLPGPNSRLPAAVDAIRCEGGRRHVTSEPSATVLSRATATPNFTDHPQKDNLTSYNVEESKLSNVTKSYAKASLPSFGDQTQSRSIGALKGQSGEVKPNLVPESAKVDAFDFGVSMNHISGFSTDENSASKSDLLNGNEDIHQEQIPSSQSAVSAAQREECPDHQQSPLHMPENPDSPQENGLNVLAFGTTTKYGGSVVVISQQSFHSPDESENSLIMSTTGATQLVTPPAGMADIGLAMGIQGTEVAKESSDIIILDDNFSSVVKVVRWGRSVYANIQKFIQFQLTVNVAALIINVVAAVSTGDVPLNAVQLLWVNLIMDTLGALALATEPPTDHLMQRPPVGRREPLVTNIMWRNILIQAAYQVTVLLVLNFEGKSILHLEDDNREHANKVKTTLIFNAFVFCQVFNEFNARKPDEINIFKGVIMNHLFMAIVAITVVLQIIIIEFLGKFASTVRLNWKYWIISVVIGFISWPLAAVGKLIPVPETPFHEYFMRRGGNRQHIECVFSPCSGILRLQVNCCRNQISCHVISGLATSAIEITEIVVPACKLFCSDICRHLSLNFEPWCPQNDKIHDLHGARERDGQRLKRNLSKVMERNHSWKLVRCQTGGQEGTGVSQCSAGGGKMLALFWLF